MSENENKPVAIGERGEFISVDQVLNKMRSALADRSKHYGVLSRGDMQAVVSYFDDVDAFKDGL